MMLGQWLAIAYNVLVYIVADNIEIGRFKYLSTKAGKKGIYFTLLPFFRKLVD